MELFIFTFPILTRVTIRALRLMCLLWPSWDCMKTVVRTGNIRFAFPFLAHCHKWFGSRPYLITWHGSYGHFMNTSAIVRTLASVECMVTVTWLKTNLKNIGIHWVKHQMNQFLMSAFGLNVNSHEIIKRVGNMFHHIRDVHAHDGTRNL
jgi:hypothetical protein